MRSDALSVLFVTLAFELSGTLPIPHGLEHDASPLNTVYSTISFVHVPLGYGYVENPSDSVWKCHDFKFWFNATGSEKIEQLIRKECQVARRITKRALEFLSEWGPFRATKNKAVLEATRRENQIIQKLQSGLEKLYAFEWSQIRNDLRNTLEYLNINVTHFMERFGIDQEFGTDILHDFSQRFFCLKDGTYLLKVCGPTNRSRKYGILNEIIPHGSFAANGSVYRYHDIPQYAIHVGKNEFHSVGTCQKLGAHYGCTELQDKQCSITSIAYCPMVTVATPDNVYTKEVDDMTLIVTDPKKHPKYKLGNAKHSVPTNGAFLISFPDTEKLRIASIEIQGRHSEHFIQNLTILQTHPDVTHDDVYQAVQKGYMTEEEADVIHGNMAAKYDTFSVENVIYYWSWIMHNVPSFVWIGLGLLGLLAIMLIVIVLLFSFMIYICKCLVIQ